MKGARVEYLKKGKPRFYFVTEDVALSIQCATEDEMHSWATELTTIGTMFSSYPSTLEMVKKLPTGNEQIQSLGTAKSLTVLGFTESLQLRTVDNMVNNNWMNWM